MTPIRRHALGALAAFALAAPSSCTAVLGLDDYRGPSGGAPSGWPDGAGWPECPTVGSPAGANCVCSTGCSPNCLAGKCTFLCRAGATCSHSCTGGECEYWCEAGSTCSNGCSGSNCTSHCAVGASCNNSCSGGGCKRSCPAGATCSNSCSGGGCADI